MTNQEYQDALKLAQDRHEENLRAIRVAYTRHHYGNIKVGDVVENHYMTMKITALRHGCIEFGGEPCVRYNGFQVKKKTHEDFVRYTPAKMSSSSIKHHYQKIQGAVK